MNGNMRWGAELKVGSDVIDNQHKILFDLVNDLNIAIGTGVNKKLVDTLLGVLRDYTFQHFHTEEEYFQTHEDAQQHCLEHYSLIKRLNVFIHDYRNNRIKGIEVPTAFLTEWLLLHIEDFDKPHLSHEAVRHKGPWEPPVIDEFDPDEQQRRMHKRIPHNEVVDGEIHALVYDASKLRSGKAKIVNMSPGGLLLSSSGNHQIEDLLLVSCSIGRNFKMEEKVTVKSANGPLYGVQFVAPARQTTDFFTKLYGSVHLNRAKMV